MSPLVIDVRNAEDPRDVVHRAVQAISEGGLVAFPTETVYGLAARALDTSAVGRLLDIKGRPANNPLALAIRGSDELSDYVPDASPLARRLARRCWPGPVTLVLDDSHPESLIWQLPSAVQRAVSPDKTVGLRVPGHSLILDVLRMIAGPVVLTSANRSGEPEASSAAEIVATFGDEVALVLVQFGLETLEQGEGIRRCARKSSQHFAVVQLANLASRPFDHDIAQSDLSIATNGHLHTRRRCTPNTENGRAVKCFHGIGLGRVLGF